MDTLAVLWDEAVKEGGQEFGNQKIKEPYKYLSRRANYQVVVGNYRDVDGTDLERGFVFEDGWQEVSGVRMDAVYDKYNWSDSTESLKQRLDSALTVVNPIETERTCKDKLETYRTFPDLVPETRKASTENARDLIEQDGSVVVKPRFDYGGHGVEVLGSVDGFEPEDGQLVQRFLDLSEGVPGVTESVHDLRALVVNGDPVLFLLRTPESGLISNVLRGASLDKVPESDVPDKVFDIIRRVDSKLEDYGPRFYTVDLCFDGERFHVLELNSKPGMAFYGDSEIREWKQPVLDRLSQLFSTVLDG
nr:MAG: prokaryotic glutathione synthetase, ATP-grasp domain family [Candidatus Nanosalinarum sp. J07AB56]